MNDLKTATRIVGDGSTRKELDFYPTPAYATEALLTKELFTGTVREPACGAGHISKVLEHRGFAVANSDISFYGFDCEQIDFLGPEVHSGFRCNNIITNPPFTHALEFIEMSKAFASDKIAMFLKTTFLEGVKRQPMFQDTNYPFKCMYQFVKRVSFGKAEETHKGGGMMAFAWFVWDKNYKGKPHIDWL